MAEHECENCDDCDCGHDHESQENILNGLDEETQRSIQELQMLEQNFQQLLMQKQAFKFELNETEVALEEVEKSEGELFKIIGNQVIVKSSKDKILQDLKHKKELIELRTKNLDKQEQDFSKRIEEIRSDIMKKISGKN